MIAIRVLIVAAYASVRAGLHAMLAGIEACVVVGDASGSAELERLLPALQPQVVLLDDGGPDTAGSLELVRASEAGLVLLGESPADGQALLDPPFPRGWAHLLKEAAGAEIAAAIGAAGAGLIALDAGAASFLRAGAAVAEGMPRPPSPPPEPLTAREREVLQLIAEGLPNKSIAVRLGISQHTAKFHVAAILAKLGAGSRTEAVSLGLRQGVVVL